jgi:hypothetical protein
MSGTNDEASRTVRHDMILPVDHRDQVARIVLIGSFVTIFLLVAVVLALPQFGADQSVTGLADKTFNVILPVLAGWVGTVLAFYFSSKSQQESLATISSRFAASTATGFERTVSQAMLAFSSIRETYDLAVKPASQITVGDLYASFERLNVSGSRLLFHEKRMFRYVLHKSLVDSLKSAGQVQDDTTLDALLVVEGVMRKVSSLVAFVEPNAPLQTAKAALDAVNGANDIIVTTTGGSRAEMVGWLSNVDLIRHLP